MAEHPGNVLNEGAALVLSIGWVGLADDRRRVLEERLDVRFILVTGELLAHRTA